MNVGTRTQKCLFVCLFVTEEILWRTAALIYVDDRQYYTVSWWASDQGSYAKQAPCYWCLFLTPRQTLSSHPRQQMVWLYWLQDRDSMPNCYTINHPTTLHTHNETQWPTAARRWHFALRDVSHRQSCHLSTPSHQVQVWKLNFEYYLIFTMIFLTEKRFSFFDK